MRSAAARLLLGLESMFRSVCSHGPTASRTYVLFCDHSGSELVYCILSLTSKLYLGWFVLSFVIWQDRTAEQSLGGSTA